MTPGLRAVVLADGDGPTRHELDRAWPGWADGVALVVAADGGARLAEPLGLQIQRWVGDGDSLEPERLATLRASGVHVNLVARDKDESDTELALLEALAAGAEDVTLVGALGGRRLDHGLANIGLLAHPALIGRGARLLDATTRVTLLRGPADARIEGRTGDLVSLLPISGRVDGIVTEGLRYPLAGESLELGPARGLSNVRRAPSAGVRLEAGLLLVIETPATLSS